MENDMLPNGTVIQSLTGLHLKNSDKWCCDLTDQCYEVISYPETVGLEEAKALPEGSVVAMHWQDGFESLRRQKTMFGWLSENLEVDNLWAAKYTIISLPKFVGVEAC